MFLFIMTKQNQPMNILKLQYLWLSGVTYSRHKKNQMFLKMKRLRVSVLSLAVGICKD